MPKPNHAEEAEKQTPREKKPTQKAVREARAEQPITHAGPAFGHEHYVFIAKVKRGEVWALNYLKTSTKSSVTPLFEMWPPKTKVKTPKSLLEHTGDVLLTVKNEWGNLPLFLDTRYILANGLPSPQAATLIFRVARRLAIQCVPVTCLRFSPAYQAAIQGVIQEDKRGVMLRIDTTDLVDEGRLKGYIDGLLTVLSLTPDSVDVVIDLAYRPNQMEVQDLGESGLRKIPYIRQWRTLTLASGCFPDVISSWPYNSWTPVDRSDWRGWGVVAANRHAAHERIPSYGDYGVRCGGIPQEIPRTPDPNLRYTSDTEIIVRRGNRVPGSMKAICRNLVQNRPEFMGAGFSQGDSEIAAKAATPGSPSNGTPEQWIQWSTNHHIEKVVSEIRNLPWP
jgi:Beta protein